MELRKLSEIEQQMSDDFDWAANAPEVQQHPNHHGKFVVVYQKRILGVGTDRKALVEEIADREQIPWRHLVVLIVPRPEPWEVPH